MCVLTHTQHGVIVPWGCYQIIYITQQTNTLSHTLNHSWDLFVGYQGINGLDEG